MTRERVRQDPERGLMLDAGRTALALRGLRKPDGCYPFIERHSWLWCHRRFRQPHVTNGFMSWLHARLSSEPRSVPRAPVRDVPVG